MSKISAVVIARNSEDLIMPCLDSLSFCDEIIVVDAGSKDKTIELAEKKGAKVLHFEPNDYAGSRNLGLKSASYDWILYVDTDERVSDELKSNIIHSINSGQISKTDNEYGVFKLKRKNFYFGNHEWPYIEKLERLFKKDSLKGWYGKIHESPSFEGKVGMLDGYLLHYTHRDLSSMVDKTIEWSKIEAELRFKSNHPKMTLWRFPRVMITAFLDSYVRQKGFKAGAVGLLESMYQSFSIFVTYARLWELQNRKKQ